MGKVDLFVDRQLIALPRKYRSGHPFTHPVHGQDRSLFKRRREKCGGGMADMVLGKAQAFMPVDFLPQRLVQGLNNHVFLKKFLLQPDRKRCGKAPDSSWGKREIRFEQALKLQERLVIKNDTINILRL